MQTDEVVVEEVVMDTVEADPGEVGVEEVDEEVAGPTTTTIGEERVVMAEAITAGAVTKATEETDGTESGKARENGEPLRVRVTSSFDNSSFFSFLFFF